MELGNVSMESIALLHTLSQKYPLSLLINLCKILIFTCFISKRCGALTMKLTIFGTSVYSHIIGKISEENLSFITTQKTNATIGDLGHI